MNSSSRMVHRRGASRPASVLIAVLVCLGIATALVTSTIRTALDTRRAMRTQHQVRQTELLLAAGIRRAQQRLTPTYAGEIWKLSPAGIPHSTAAEVIIAIVPATEGAARAVRVTARLTVTPHKTIQRSYTFSDP